VSENPDIPSAPLPTSDTDATPCPVCDTHHPVTAACTQDYQREHPFPPPVITRWLQHRTVPTDDLVQELDYWAHHMAGGTDDNYEPRYRHV
jgi:hypothetical protein